jgi:hypothetical protein
VEGAASARIQAAINEFLLLLLLWQCFHLKVRETLQTPSKLDIVRRKEIKRLSSRTIDTWYDIPKTYKKMTRIWKRQPTKPKTTTFNTSISTKYLQNIKQAA